MNAMCYECYTELTMKEIYRSKFILPYCYKYLKLTSIGWY